MWVSGRIVQRRIDAVDDAREMFTAAMQETVQPFTKIFILDFLGVGAAHRGDMIGVDDGSLHEIHGVVIFQVPVVEIFPIEP